eukprot:6927140-Lingulodinium_polyedra.AAC.1
MPCRPLPVRPPRCGRISASTSCAKNAGSAKDTLKLAMGRAMGMDDVTTNLRIPASYASKWTVMPR